MDSEAAMKPKKYQPRNCTNCTTKRPNPADNFVIVYHTTRQDGYIYRYCKCRFCNHTFKEVEKPK